MKNNKIKESTPRSPYEEGKLISVYESRGGKYWMEIFETGRGNFSYHGSGISGNVNSLDDILLKLWIEYLDTPSFECVEGDVISGYLYGRGSAFFSVEDPRVKKLSKEKLEENGLEYFFFEASPRGFKTALKVFEEKSRESERVTGKHYH